MTHEAEHKLELKIDAIHALLVGLEGQPETGFVGRTNARLTNHSGRIGRLEKFVTGGLAVGGVVILLLKYPQIIRFLGAL